MDGKNMSQNKKFLTIAGAADFLKVSKTSLRRWTNKGYLKCYRIGRRNERRFLVEDLLAFMPPSEQPLSGPSQDGALPGAPTLAARAHRHVCTYFRDAAEQWRLFQPYLARHSGADARIVYVYHEDAGRIESWLKSEGRDPAVLRAEGRLRLIPSNAAYLVDGRFDTDRMLEFWAEIIAANERIGTSRLLLTGEMTWATGNAPGCEALIDYEVALEEALLDYPWVTVVCQYDLNAFPATTIFESLCVHPGVQLDVGLTTGLMPQIA